MEPELVQMPAMIVEEEPVVEEDAGQVVPEPEPVAQPEVINEI